MASGRPPEAVNISEGVSGVPGEAMASIDCGSCGDGEFPPSFQAAFWGDAHGGWRPRGDAELLLGAAAVSCPGVAPLARFPFQIGTVLGRHRPG